MNNNLIFKTITSNSGTCPDFVYKNPLLDKSVAKALAKSFVKILNVSEANSKINNNLRLSILENIRRMCTSGPQNHVPVDESLTHTLTELYEEHTAAAAAMNSKSVKRQLDAFLIRRFKEMNINPSYMSTITPEVIQALINLNNNGVYLDMLSKDIVHWHLRNGNYMCILRDLWEYKLPDKFNNKMFDDIALKMKPEIEKIMLHICLEIMIESNVNIELMFAPGSALSELIKKCTLSPICFQMCCGILNFIFIMTNFDPRMQIFIPKFISQVKSNLSGTTTALYPLHLNHLVILLDFNIDMLPEPLRLQYISPTLNYLQKLHEESENDLILMLSHYPQWLDIYSKGCSQT